MIWTPYWAFTNIIYIRGAVLGIYVEGCHIIHIGGDCIGLNPQRTPEDFWMEWYRFYAAVVIQRNFLRAEEAREERDARLGRAVRMNAYARSLIRARSTFQG